jgi:hypothetical protein
MAAGWVRFASTVPGLLLYIPADALIDRFSFPVGEESVPVMGRRIAVRAHPDADLQAVEEPTADEPPRSRRTSSVIGTPPLFRLAISPIGFTVGPAGWPSGLLRSA